MVLFPTLDSGHITIVVLLYALPFRLHLIRVELVASWQSLILNTELVTQEAD